jgi:hypothetical protein
LPGVGTCVSLHLQAMQIKATLLSDLSSRPKRSAVEGPAFLSTCNRCKSRPLCSQTCHPDRSETKWRTCFSLHLQPMQIKVTLLSDLSSRPKRSAVEGPAFLSTCNRCKSRSRCSQTCHPVDKPKGVVKGVRMRRVARSNSLAMSLETWRHASPLRESFSVESDLPPAIDTDQPRP